MSRTTRSAARSAQAAVGSGRANGRNTLETRAASTKKESSPPLKEETNGASPPDLLASKKRTRASPAAHGKSKKIKVDPDESLPTPKSQSSPSPQSTPKAKGKNGGRQDLRAKKLKSYAQFAKQSPFPDFARPTPAECKLAHRILASLHGARTRPKQVVASTTRAGCGDSPSVLDALVRTILSQNTSDANSTRAKQSMDKTYGRSDKWDAIVAGGEAKLQEAIKCGGLSVVKSRVIISILRQAHEKYGTYSLDHLHDASNDEAMSEMLAFQGVGPKTASCVLLFCLQRESFAVDTHVWRITGLLGWRPKQASRDETHAHLDALIPDEDKYGLHILLVTHGKRCDECKAGGKSLGKCELRKAFAKGKLEGEAGEKVKKEELENLDDSQQSVLKEEATIKKEASPQA